jgi:acyl-coenzyme A synthetase/AMP-(fatty) acid ligase
VHIVDRLKELIKGLLGNFVHKKLFLVSGRQVAPAELENILMSHPSIADCAVMGVTRDKCVEVPKAFVVLKRNKCFEKYIQILADKTPSSELVNELIKYVRERVSPYKQLSGGVQFCLSIPRSSAGKILRSSLKDQVNK